MLTIDSVMGRGPKVFGKTVWADDETLRAAVRRRAEHFLAGLKTIEKKRGQNPRKVRAAVHSMLNSFDARFVCLILSFPKKASPFSHKEAAALAAETSPWTDCLEPVRFFLRAKMEGGSRPIWDFGPKRRLLQCLAREVLRAIWGPMKSEYAQRGRGRDAAITQIQKLTEMKGGARWFLTADIENCFGSFNREALLKLIPLPRSVTENCIFVMNGTTIISPMGLSVSASEKAVLSGLPQGSLASSYIASKLIEPVVEKLQGVVKLSYADDIIVGSRKQEEAEANKLLLGDLLRDHPAGPLFMKATVATLGQPIDYLGYRFRRRPLKFGGGVRCTPSPKAFKRFEVRAHGRLVNEPVKTRYAKAEEYKRHWCGSYKCWDRSELGDLLVTITMNDVLTGISYANYLKKTKA